MVSWMRGATGPLLLDHFLEPARAHGTAARGFECDREDYPARPFDGCNLPGPRAADLPSQRSPYCCPIAGIPPVPGPPRAGDAHRRQMARGHNDQQPARQAYMTDTADPASNPNRFEVRVTA